MTSTKSLKITQPWLQPMNAGSVAVLRKKTPGANSVTAVSVGTNQPEAKPATAARIRRVDPTIKSAF